MLITSQYNTSNVTVVYLLTPLNQLSNIDLKRFFFLFFPFLFFFSQASSKRKQLRTYIINYNPIGCLPKKKKKIYTFTRNTILIIHLLNAIISWRRRRRQPGAVVMYCINIVLCIVNIIVHKYSMYIHTYIFSRYVLQLYIHILLHGGKGLYDVCK